ncbi:MAG: serine/threonine protein kinase [Myxococcales bacterium]|nr:serine/threonine protein kinase [Myxococcales bacterium]
MQVADRYRLVARRGRGGIGEVWEARQAPSGRKVAVKLLLPGWQTDQNVRKRFIREGRLASTMQHRHIVDILEAGETRDGQPFIAMELLRGPSLDVVVREQGPLPWDRVKRILLQVCGALDHAHGLKIIHRDVKPSNIMLDGEPGEAERCKLVDFGIAKQSLVHLQTQHLTGEGQLLGSPGFMSPEQLQGRPTDHRSDVYGLGCTGFYLLTGEVPFAGGSLPEMIHNALYHLPRSLEGVELDDDLRQHVEAVLHRAVHRDPEARFSSILDFVVALDRVGSALPAWGGARGPQPAETSPEGSGELLPATAIDSGDLAPTALRSPSLGDGLRRASDVPTQAVAMISAPTAAPSLERPRPSTTPRGVISTQSHSQVLQGQATAERVSWGGPDGFVEVVRVPPDVIVVHVSGHVGSTAAWLFEQQLGPLLARHRPTHLFWHLGALESQPSAVRDASLRCLSDHRDDIESVHVLSGSGLVGTSVTLAAVALGSKTQVYDDETAWRSALDARATGGPS